MTAALLVILSAMASLGAALWAGAVGPGALLDAITVALALLTTAGVACADGLDG